MESRFGENRFACQQRFRYVFSHTDRPIVIAIITAEEGDQEPGICDTFHERERE